MHQVSEELLAAKKDAVQKLDHCISQKSAVKISSTIATSKNVAVVCKAITH